MDDLLKPSHVRKDRRPLPSYLPRDVGGRFRILSLIGSGACGDVVEAYDLQVKDLVALKLLRVERVSERVVKRFFREATAMGRVKHPGVVRVRDAGTDANGVHYLAMDLIRGKSLRDVMRDRDGRLSAWEAARIAVEVCEVLQVAHSLGVIHRDLKPGNLIIPEGWPNNDESVKVVDFGVAKVYDGPEDEPLTNLTQSGESLGTPHYMAPEQVSGKPIDGRTDLYGLGCIMYHAVSGYRPIDGPNQFAVLMGHLERRPVPLAQVVGAEYAPPYFSSFIDRLLAKRPDDRPVNAAAAEAELRQCLDLLPRRAPPMVQPPPAAEELETFNSLGKALQITSGDAIPARTGPQEVPQTGRNAAATAPPPEPRAQQPPAPRPRPHDPTVPVSIDFERAPRHQEASARNLGKLPTEQAMKAAVEPGDDAEPAPEPPHAASRVGLIIFVLGVVGLLLALITIGGLVYLKRPDLLGLAPAPTTTAQNDPDQNEPDKNDPDQAPDASPDKATRRAPDKTTRRAEPTPETSTPVEKPADPPAATGPVILTFNTTPDGAEIFRNGQRLGRAGSSIKLERPLAAPAVFLLVRPDHQAEPVIIQPADLQGKASLAIDRDLRPLGNGTSTIEIHTDPPGAQVKMGSRFLGITPVAISQPLRKQTVRVRLEADGAPPRDILLGLRREPQIVRVPLGKPDDPIPELVNR